MAVGGIIGAESACAVAAARAASLRPSVALPRPRPALLAEPCAPLPRAENPEENRLEFSPGENRASGEKFSPEFSAGERHQKTGIQT